MVLQMLLQSSSKDRESRGSFGVGRQSIPEGCNAKAKGTASMRAGCSVYRHINTTTASVHCGS